MNKKKSIKSKAIVTFLCLGLCLFINACSMFQFEEVTVTPLTFPGAEYVGSETCSAAECHQTEQKYFDLTDHASVTIDLTEEDLEAGHAEGCETCHGPGSLHLEGQEDGNITVIDEETCFTCHLDIKAKFMLQHHHPVREGRMTCSDCHNLHGSDVRATGGSMLLGKDEKCFACHKEMKGPFVFEHEAMREGCTVCHNPHGSISDKLLVAGQTITCVRCHVESKFGDIHHDGDAGHTNCIDCHTRIHGSNNAKSSLRY